MHTIERLTLQGDWSKVIEYDADKVGISKVVEIFTRYALNNNGSWRLTIAST